MSEDNMKEAIDCIHALAKIDSKTVMKAVTLAALKGRNCVTGSGKVIPKVELERIAEFAKNVMCEVQLLSAVLDQDIAIFGEEEISFSLTEQGRAKADKEFAAMPPTAD